MRRALWVLALIAVLTYACGDDGAGSSPAATTPPSDIPPAATTPAGPASPVAGAIDLSQQQAALTIWGADGGDFNNDLPLLATGDFNDDGLDDLLIGARFGDGPGNTRQDAGEAYLIFGRDPLPETIDIAAGEPDVTFYGAAENDHFSFAGLFADLNNDGVDDIVVSAPFGERGLGLVYVFFGGADLGPVVDLSAAAADLELIGADGNSFFGDAVSATDANGDGATDLIVGSTFARRPTDLEYPGAQAGATYVFFGDALIGGLRDAANGDYDAVIYGENADPHPDELGDTVWGADINGDGTGDIIMTAEAADTPGNQRSVAAEVHVLFGSADLGGVYDIARGDQDLSVYGADQNDTLGFQLSAGDVNNDGISDLLASARGADGPGNSGSETGEVHIILGGDNLPGTVDLLNDESDAYLYGDTNAEMLGYSIQVLDVDGDGRNELMVGSGFADAPGRLDAGMVHILDASGLEGGVQVSEAPSLLFIVGAQASDALGTAVTSGDLDGDGSVEVITLALRADGPDDSRPEAGEIYVVKP